ncbi:hypothetical protein K505DRAFT_324486 [Melanomma pulvis-pyrius CBS 109.77]|uniref:Uncharacterized protein n=1 Tax=Melanomma pulvis-pyrius CBS 109.77 TaxID=1314802 RepID=A0A6A6XEH4_9PLEO|nr:hypothetical protein K505DRAFT_324486 [Melanomma pulvis-pyrius CBS 109.77]
MLQSPWVGPSFTGSSSPVVCFSFSVIWEIVSLSRISDGSAPPPVSPLVVPESCVGALCAMGVGLPCIGVSWPVILRSLRIMSWATCAGGCRVCGYEGAVLVLQGRYGERCQRSRRPDEARDDEEGDWHGMGPVRYPDDGFRGGITQGT